MKRVVLTVMKIWLSFSTIEELQNYKESNKYKSWKFIEEFEYNNCYILVVEKPYGEVSVKDLTTSKVVSDYKK